MGRNKLTRKQMRGELRVIREHLLKIEQELQKPVPSRSWIEKWEKDIERHQRLYDKLKSKLPGGKE